MPFYFFNFRKQLSCYDEFGGNINSSGKGALLKLDGQGNIKWVKTLSVKGDNDYFQFFLNKANEVIIVGNVVDTTWVADTILVKTRPQVANGMNEMFVLKLNENGTAVWESRIAVDHYITLRGGTIDLNNNINLMGEFEPPYILTSSDSVSCSGIDRIFVMQLADNSVPLSLGFLEAQKSYSEIYPNPTSGISTVNLHNNGDATIFIYDVLGNCMLKKECRNEVYTTIDFSSQPKGIYFMEIVSDRTKSVNKIVVQ